MEKGSEPQTESERADLDAIAALKENTAIELKVFFLSHTIKALDRIILSLFFHIYIFFVGFGRTRVTSM